MIKTWRFNPVYIYSRIKTNNYFKDNQNLPWLVEDANNFLINNLNQSMRVLEFGSGRSTHFFVERVNEVVSREHNEQWFEIVSKQVTGLNNVKYSLHTDLDDYANVDDLEDNSFDVVLVDGRNRGKCLLNSIQKLKSGGLLILDNSERYLIYPTKAPAKFVRPERSSEWEDAEKALSENFWKINMTNRVTDTYLFFKR